MTGYHARCDDESCNFRCRRPGCLRVAEHFLTDLRRVNKRWSAAHSYNCAIPFPGVTVGRVARQAIEELNAETGPGEVARARKLIGLALDRLEHLQKTTVTVVDPPPAAPLLLTAAKEHKRPHVVAAPRELTRAQAQHLQWLAQKRERTA
jgi:hypothetical protein